MKVNRWDLIQKKLRKEREVRRRRKRLRREEGRWGLMRRMIQQKEG